MLELLSLPPLAAIVDQLGHAGHVVGDAGGDHRLFLYRRGDRVGAFHQPVDAFLYLLHGLGDVLGNGLDALDFVVDFSGGVFRLRGEAFDFVGHHGEAAAGIASTGGLDSRVQCQQVDLAGDVLDEGRDCAHRLGGLHQLADRAAGIFRLALHVLHGISGRAGTAGDVGDGTGELLQRGGDGFNRLITFHIGAFLGGDIVGVFGNASDVAVVIVFDRIGGLQPDILLLFADTAKLSGLDFAAVEGVPELLIFPAVGVFGLYKHAVMAPHDFLDPLKAHGFQKILLAHWTLPEVSKWMMAWLLSNADMMLLWSEPLRWGR